MAALRLLVALVFALVSPAAPALVDGNDSAVAVTLDAGGSASATAVPSPSASLPACSSRIISSARIPPPRDGPPRAMPPDLVAAFTRCGAIPIGDYFVDDTNQGKGTHYRYSDKEMARQVAAARQLVTSVARLAALPVPALPLGKGLGLLAEALRRYAGDVAGKRVIVFGSQTPVVETLLLAYNVSSVTTVEYQRLSYSGVVTLTPAELATLPEAERRFDLALSISSFDHDGLGRYGDPLCPDGDLVSNDAVRELYLRPGGLYFLTVPVGHDYIVWNLHRVYGPIRLPLLLHGWSEVERVGWEPAILTEERSFTNSKEPVFVLRAPVREEAVASSEAGAALAEVVPPVEEVVPVEPPAM